MRKIGKYEIVEKIGAGGFGEVFKGRDPFIKRYVAIKTCNSKDQLVRDRFFREAEIAGGLSHRNITTVYDFGIHDSLPYLIQEYLSGEDLDRKIKRQDYLPYPEKLFYLLQISRGLAYAHSQGVIHRDIKPGNIRILEDGTAKIMDFGIAKLAQQETSLTQTGMTLGTAAYLAPEQIRGDPVDLRTDVFSFGVLAYELLTYERPFKGQQISAVLHQIINLEPEPLTSKWSSAPAEVTSLIDRCLRKSPPQRFADGSELLQTIEVIQKRGRSARRLSDEIPTVRLQKPPVPEAPPPPRPVVATRPLGESERPAPRPTLEDIEFFLHRGDDPSGPAAAAGAASRGSRRSRLPTVTGIVLAAVLAVAGGWWLGARDDGSGATGSRQAPPAVDAATESDRSDRSDPSDLSNLSDLSDPSDLSSDSGKPPATTGEEAAPPAAPAPPPPPPPPRLGTVTLEAVGWTDQMSVEVGGKSYPLIRPWRIELPPGSHRADFQLTLPDYRRQASVTVEVAAGRTTPLASPIARPGSLSVRPLPTKPRGKIWRRGQSLGLSPVTRVLSEPGRCTIEIRPLGGAGETVKWQGTIQSGHETVLSFDLESGTVLESTKPLDR